MARTNFIERFTRELTRGKRKRKPASVVAATVTPAPAAEPPLTRKELVAALVSLADELDEVEANAGGTTPAPKAALLRQLAEKLEPSG